MSLAYLQPTYQPGIVALSVLVAAYASYVALGLARRVRVRDAYSTAEWTVGGVQQLKIDSSFVRDSRRQRRCARGGIGRGAAGACPGHARGRRGRGNRRAAPPPGGSGCDELQGFFFAHPMTADALAANGMVC